MVFVLLLLAQKSPSSGSSNLAPSFSFLHSDNLGWFTLDLFSTTTTHRCPGPLGDHYTNRCTSPLLVFSSLLSLGPLTLALPVPLLQMPSTLNCLNAHKKKGGALEVGPMPVFP